MIPWPRRNSACREGLFPASPCLGSGVNYDGLAALSLYGCVILFISQTVGVPVTLGTMVIILMSEYSFPLAAAVSREAASVKLLVVVTAF